MVGERVGNKSFLGIVARVPDVVFCFHNFLVGGFNPFEKYYSSQSGSFPQVEVTIKHIRNHQPVLLPFNNGKSPPSCSKHYLLPATPAVF